MLSLGEKSPFLFIEGSPAIDVAFLGLIEVNDGFLFLGDFFFQLGDLVDDLVEFFLGFQQFSTDFAGTNLRVEEFLVFLFDLFHVFLVLDLQLVEVNELQFVSHLLLLSDLVSCLHDLRGKSGLLVFVLLNEGSLLLVLLLEKLFNAFCLDVTSATVLAPHQYLSLEVVGVLPDFCDGHVGLF